MLRGGTPPSALARHHWVVFVVLTSSWLSQFPKTLSHVHGTRGTKHIYTMRSCQAWCIRAGAVLPHICGAAPAGL